MTYPDAIQFLYGLQLFGANFGLERARQLAELAGNPHHHLRFIHVAGTNGKGSVCALLESVYRAAGLRTGLFTSPHLVHFGERLQVDRQLPAEAEIVKLVERMRGILDKGARRGWWDSTAVGDKDIALGHPTFFEVVTIIGLIHFAERGCDLVLWETGLGGRLDATNIVTPLVSVITNVSLEHAAILGETTAKIAAEKSGIIKPRVPVITATDDPNALRVIREVAASRNCPLREISVVADVETDVANSPIANGQSLPAKLFAPGYQRANARLALEIVEMLNGEFPIKMPEIEAGLKTAKWEGRLQEFNRQGRRIIVDGAHNPAGVHALKQTLLARNDWQPCTVIFGTFVDKDAKLELQELAPLASRIVFVPVHSPRTANPRELQETFALLGSRATDSVACDSLEKALALTAKAPVTLITGSLYLVGEAIAWLDGSKPKTPASEQALNHWSFPSPPVPSQKEYR